MKLSAHHAARRARRHRRRRGHGAGRARRVRRPAGPRAAHVRAASPACCRTRAKDHTGVVAVGPGFLQVAPLARQGDQRRAIACSCSSIRRCGASDVDRARPRRIWPPPTASSRPGPRARRRLPGAARSAASGPRPASTPAGARPTEPPLSRGGRRCRQGRLRHPGLRFPPRTRRHARDRPGRGCARRFAREFDVGIKRRGGCSGPSCRARTVVYLHGLGDNRGSGSGSPTLHDARDTTCWPTTARPRRSGVTPAPTASTRSGPAACRSTRSARAGDPIRRLPGRRHRAAGRRRGSADRARRRRRHHRRISDGGQRARPFFASRANIDKALAIAEEKRQFRIDDVSAAAAATRFGLRHGGPRPGAITRRRTRIRADLRRAGGTEEAGACPRRDTGISHGAWRN